MLVVIVVRPSARERGLDCLQETQATLVQKGPAFESLACLLFALLSFNLNRLTEYIALGTRWTLSRASFRCPRERFILHYILWYTLIDLTKQLARQFLQFAMVVASAFMAWKTLSIYTNCESPIVVVLRFGLALLPLLHTANNTTQLANKWINGAGVCPRGLALPLPLPCSIPSRRHSRVPHQGKGHSHCSSLNGSTRGVGCLTCTALNALLNNTSQSNKTGTEYLLTKGDNNPVDDRGLYNPGQYWVTKDDIMGRVQGSVSLLLL